MARPARFYFLTPKVRGEPFLLRADEWNALIDAVNALRTYRGLPTAAMTPAVWGQPFTAVQYGQVRAAILAMAPHAAIPTASAGDTVAADALNALVDTINAIP